MNEHKLSRNCPQCGKELFYCSFKTRNRAEKLKWKCLSCASKNQNTQKMFFRNCSVCGKRLGYVTEKEQQRAEKRNGKCRKCSSGQRSEIKPHSRMCSKCGKELRYTSIKARNLAERKSGICRSCKAKIVQNNPEIRARINQKLSVLNSGENNPFFGKKHSKETVDKIIASQRRHGFDFCRTKEFKDKCRKFGEKNGMFGKTYYDVWVSRYGEKIANQMVEERRKRFSERFGGEKNPMFGKPAPKGSGSGWSGYYKGIYFRSLMELSFLVTTEKLGKKCESAETKDLFVKYSDPITGKERTYRADFLVDKHFLVEVKPEALMHAPTNKAKKDAAERFCKESGLEYRLVEVRTLPLDEIIALYRSKKVVFNRKYQEVMEALICKLEKTGKSPSKSSLRFRSLKRELMK